MGRALLCMGRGHVVCRCLASCLPLFITLKEHPLLLLLCRSNETAAGKAPAAAQTKQSSDVFVDLTLSDEESADGEAASAPACKKGVCLTPNGGLL